MILKKTIKLYGVAGSGKTTTCYKLIKQFIEEGYRIDEICFTTYTRAGIKSMLDKLNENNVEITYNRCNFRSLNSLTWRLSGFDREMTINENERKQFFDELGIKTQSEDEYSISEMDIILDIYNSLLNHEGKSYNKIPMYLIYSFVLEYIENKELNILDKEVIINVMKKYEEWKIIKNCKDYIDSIIYCIENEIDIHEKILIVDEAQDLGKSMTILIDLWTKKYTRDYFIIAGDDDQCVHEWAGAKPDYLIEYKNDNMEEIILTHSYRLPKNIAILCNMILDMIEYRKRKTISSDKKDGLITYIEGLNEYNISNFLKENIVQEEDTFILFRTNKILREISDVMFKELNIPFGSLSAENKTKWTDKFVLISNALNKIKENKEMTQIELKNLIGVLSSKECLVHGAKAKINSMEISRRISPKEFFEMTKIWKRQKTLLDDNYDIKISKKDKIIEYIRYDKRKENDKNIIKRNELYKEKLKQVDKIFDYKIDSLGKPDIQHRLKIGTFHSSKGLQAKNVIVFLGTNNRFSDINDSEKRCFYVACSRTECKLYLIGCVGFKDYKFFLEEYFLRYIRKQISTS